MRLGHDSEPWGLAGILHDLEFLFIAISAMQGIDKDLGLA